MWGPTPEWQGASVWAEIQLKDTRGRSGGGAEMAVILGGPYVHTLSLIAG